MEGWTRFVLRFRWPILVGWLVVLLAGGFASTKLSALLSNTFTVPGTDSERARTILERHYGDRSDGVRAGARAGRRARALRRHRLDAEPREGEGVRRRRLLRATARRRRRVVRH